MYSIELMPVIEHIQKEELNWGKTAKIGELEIYRVQFKIAYLQKYCIRGYRSCRGLLYLNPIEDFITQVTLVK